MIAFKVIDEIANKIAINFQPDKILLFGSYANGGANNDSDIDLLIIKNSDLPRYKRSAEIRKSLIGTKEPIDVIVYTQEEFDKEKDDEYSFLNTAIKTAKVLYERIH